MVLNILHGTQEIPQGTEHKLYTSILSRCQFMSQNPCKLDPIKRHFVSHYFILDIEMVNRAVKSALLHSLHPQASIFERYSSFRQTPTIDGHALQLPKYCTVGEKSPLQFPVF